MPYFIATTWTLNDDGEGPVWRREVIRRSAPTEQDFRADIFEESADDEIYIGPVSLSKHQGILV